MRSSCWSNISVGGQQTFKHESKTMLTHLAYVPSGTSGMESELEAAKGDEEKEQVEDNVDKLDVLEGVGDQGSKEDEHRFEDS